MKGLAQVGSTDIFFDILGSISAVGSGQGGVERTVSLSKTTCMGVMHAIAC